MKDTTKDRVKPKRGQGGRYSTRSSQLSQRIPIPLLLPPHKESLESLLAEKSVYMLIDKSNDLCLSYFGNSRRVGQVLHY